MMSPLRTVLLVKPAERGLLGTPENGADKAVFPPLELATIAALTPGGIQVDVWDERILGPIGPSTRLARDYDLVGVTGYLADYRRMIELGDLFRARGVPTVAGGVGVTSAPQVFREHFDVLFLGEAEYTWPQFIADFQAGCRRSQYRQVSKVDLADSPAPSWAGMAGYIKRYGMGPVQTTRGCPFDCEFCDVIYLYGRRPRQKAVGRVLEEVRALERLGFRQLFLSDDNLYGDPRRAKALLRALVELNRSLPHPLAFGTQISMDIASDEEMLSLLAEASVDLLFIGIESPNKESLQQAHKLQNFRLDLVEAIKKIQSYGLTVLGSLIVGFDQDDATIFQRQFEFIQEACLPGVNIRVLSAIPGTRLWARLHKEGRVLDDFCLRRARGYMTKWARTNAVPKQMTLVELLSGYRDLLAKVFDWDNFEARLTAMLRLIDHAPARPKRPWGAALRGAPRAVASIVAGLRPLVTSRQARRMTWGFLADRRARRALWRCLRLASPHGPLVRRATFVQILMQHMAAKYAVPKMIAEINEELPRLADQDRLAREPTVFAVPESFREPYRAILPELDGHVRGGLSDKSRAEDVLVEVIHDFLTRWGPTFESFEEYHRQFLFELCDRTVAQENRTVGAASDSAARAPAERPMRTLADEVLRCVEEEFRNARPRPTLD